MASNLDILKNEKNYSTTNTIIGIIFTAHTGKYAEYESPEYESPEYNGANELSLPSIKEAVKNIIDTSDKISIKDMNTKMNFGGKDYSVWAIDDTNGARKEMGIDLVGADGTFTSGTYEILTKRVLEANGIKNTSGELSNDEKKALIDLFPLKKPVEPVNEEELSPYMQAKKREMRRRKGQATTYMGKDARKEIKARRRGESFGGKRRKSRKRKSRKTRRKRRKSRRKSRRRKRRRKRRTRRRR